MVNPKLLNCLESMSNIAGLPECHKGDLVMDARALSESIEPHIWFLKPAGTVTIPVGKGTNPAYIETFMELPHAAFLVDDGAITPINDDELLDLVNREPIDFDAIQTLNQLVDSVERVLDDPVNKSVDAGGELLPVSSWLLWREKFQLNGNTLMDRVMEKAICLALKFQKETCNA
ncbi:hypothetical protein ACRZ5S_22660 (plasmid) [Vibrio scophthalmi]|uniref:hypothetical protein n=1 Tax=Vibrio scophthalmi TaxID=45658 RepID=UPI003EBC166E